MNILARALKDYNPDKTTHQIYVNVEKLNMLAGILADHMDEPFFINSDWNGETYLHRHTALPPFINF